MVKIIIVDDESASLNSMGRVISGIRKDVEIAGLFNSINLAMDFLRENSVDIILSDIKMPGGGGIELARFVQENYPEIKIVFFSAYNDFEYAQQAIILNVKHYLSKPVNIEELNRTLNNLIELVNKENKNREEEKIKEKKYKELLLMAKTDLYSDILAGYLYKENEIALRIKNLDMTERETDVCHGVVMARCKNPDLLLEGLNEYYHVLEDMMQEVNCIKENITVIKLQNEVVSVVRFNEKMNREEATGRLQKELEKVKGNMLESLDIETSFEVAYVCESIYKLCGYKNIIDDDDLFEMKFNELSSALFESDSDEVKRVFDTIVCYAQTLEINRAKRIFEEMFIYLKNFFSGSFSEGNNVFEYSQIWKTERMSDIIEIAEVVVNKIQKEKSASSKGIGAFTIELIKEYVEENYMRDIVLEDVANHVNLSSFYTSKFFKSRTGQGLSDYITSVRISAAIELIKTQKYKVYEISEMCGYKSRKYFTHAFKQHTGYTPSEYQRIL